MDSRTVNKAEIHIEVRFTLSDFFRPFKPSKTNLVCWTLAVAAWAAIYVLFFSPSAQRQGYLAPIKPAACVVGICLTVALLAAPYLQARMAANNAPIFQETFHYTVSSLGVHVQTENSRTEYTWSAFREVVETPELFILRRRTDSASYLPKRCFSKPEDVPRLRSLISDYFRGDCNFQNN